MPPMRRIGYSKVSLANAKKARRSNKSRYKKKTSSKKRSGGNVDMMVYKSIAKELIKNQLHVFQYPFSTKTKYPKIPDGLVNDSVGLSFCYSEKVTYNPELDLFFVLYPGHTTCVACYQINDDVMSILSYGKFIQHLIPREVTEENNYELLYDETGFSGYRYVSCGLRITTDQGEHINNGNWSAVRLNTNEIGRDFIYCWEQQHPNWNSLLPSSILHNRVDGNLTNNPSFQNGLMKTIDDYEFRLRPVKMEHNVIALPEKIELVSTNFLDTYEDDADNSDQQKLFRHCLDTAFDCIVIKINSSTGSRLNLANVTYNVVANIECIPDSGSKFAHFSTAGLHGASKFYKLQNSMQRDSRVAGTYNYNKRYQKHM